MNKILREELSLDNAIAMASNGTLSQKIKGTQFEGKTLNEIFHLVKKDGTPSLRARNTVVLETRVAREVKPRYSHKKMVSYDGRDVVVTYEVNTGKVVSKVYGSYHKF